MTTTKRLKYIAPLRRDLLPGRPEGLRYLGLENIEAHTGRLLLESEQEAVDSSVVAFDEESVLFGKLRPYLAKVAVPDFTGVGSSEILVFQPRPATDRRFLYYALLAQDFVSRVSALVDGAKMPRAEPAGVANLALYAPPLPEQRRIANYLDEQTAKIDRLIELRRRQIELLAEQRACAIQQAVTKGLDPTVPMKDSGVPWLGEIPAHWEVKRLKHVAGIVPGGTPDSKRPEYWDGEIVWLTPVDLGKADCMHTASSARRLTAEGVLAAGLSLAPEGSCALSTRAPIGSVSRLTCEGTANQGCKLIIPKPDLDCAFLFYLLNVYGEVLVSLGQGTTFQEVTTYNVSNITLAVPPRSEQCQIADYTRALTGSYDDAASNHARQIALLTEYRAALINECVTGQRRVEEAEEGDSADR